MSKKKELVAYCGLYCGDCAKFKGNISKSAKNLKKIITEENFKKLASSMPEIDKYDDFMRTLDILTEFKCECGCRSGGGNNECEIKICCRDKGYETCADCEKFEYCPELARIPNLLCGIISYVKELKRIREIGLDNWLNEKP